MQDTAGGRLQEVETNEEAWVDTSNEETLL